MRKILITISYDGTKYFGWQKQKEQMTIEGCLEKACEKVFVKGFELVGTSRTDRGVHALGQRASIQTDSKIPTDKICYALNANLPNDIVVTKAEEVPLEFHPRYNCKQKTYEYRILNTEFMQPKLLNYAEHERRFLDIEKMRQAAKYLEGEHDFKAFCASGTTVSSTVRTIYKIIVEKEEDTVIFKFTGNGFLYNMVRILSGTLVYVGLGKIKPEQIPEIIESKDRSKAGKTLSPNGLTLLEIEY